MTNLSYVPNHEMTLRDYVRVLFKQKWVIILSFILISPIVFVGVAFQTPTYEASVKMLVTASKQVDAPYYKELLNGYQNQVNLTQSEIVLSEPVLQRVVYALRLYDRSVNYEYEYASPIKQKWIKLQAKMYEARLEDRPAAEKKQLNFRRAVDYLKRSIKVTPVKDTNLFTITVSDYDRYGAMILANVISRSYIIFDLEQQMAESLLKYGSKHPVVMQLQDNIQKMKDNLSGRTLSNADAIGPASVKIIEQATMPLTPVGSKKMLIVLIALISSVFFGMMLAFLFDYMDQSIKTPRDVESTLQIPFLGSIPLVRSHRKALFIKGEINPKLPSQYVKAFKELSDQLQLLIAQQPFKTLYLATSDSQDGEGLLAAHLGYQLAHYGNKKVLIIDANFRGSQLKQDLQLNDGPGLVDVLIGQAQLANAVQTIAPNLSVLPSGSTTLNPITFLDTSRTMLMIDGLKMKYDLIIIISAELKSYQDGYMIASVSDKVLFVVTENGTRRQVARAEMKNLKERKASLLGALLKDRTYPIPEVVYNHI